MTTTRELAKTLTQEINEAVNIVLARHGMSSDKVKTVYGDYYEIKIQASQIETNAAGIKTSTPEMQDLRAVALGYNITDIEADLASEEPIVIGGKRYVPAGFKTRARTRPFLMKNVEDGKTYIFGREVARFFPSYVAPLKPETKLTQVGIDPFGTGA
jgi:hypothetical protein